MTTIYFKGADGKRVYIDVEDEFAAAYHESRLVINRNNDQEEYWRDKKLGNLNDHDEELTAKGSNPEEVLADTGLTGRKIVADAYGPRVPVGGGAFSGKDPSKVDRSGAYFARYIARNIVEGGIAEKCQVAIAYAIGKAEPLAVNIDTFGTGKAEDDAIRQAVLEVFDFRPAEIIRQLDLKKPIYTGTATGGHFGKDAFPWEQADRVSELRKALFGD